MVIDIKCNKNHKFSVCLVDCRDIFIQNFGFRFWISFTNFLYQFPCCFFPWQKSFDNNISLWIGNNQKQMAPFTRRFSAFNLAWHGRAEIYVGTHTNERNKEIDKSKWMTFLCLEKHSSLQQVIIKRNRSINCFLRTEKKVSLITAII